MSEQKEQSTKDRISISIEDRINMLNEACVMQKSAYVDQDYDPYMHGLANGLVISVAIMQDKEPELLSAFDKKKRMDSQAKAVASRPKNPIDYDH